jgi:hypothetical protein
LCYAGCFTDFVAEVVAVHDGGAVADATAGAFVVTFEVKGVGLLVLSWV